VYSAGAEYRRPPTDFTREEAGRLSERSASRFNAAASYNAIGNTAFG